MNAQSLNDTAGVIIKAATIFPEGTFNACHASTIVELDRERYLAAWFAGSYEGANDVGIWIATSTKDGWTAPIEAATGIDSTGKRLPCWNPVLFKTKNHMLYLFYKVGVNPREWRGMVIRSSDDGRHWTVPEALPTGFLGPIKNKPLQLDDGSLLCPSSVESIDEKKWTVHLEITNEALTTWKRIDIEADDSVGVIQPSIVRHKDGRLQMLCRSRQNMIYQTWSRDNGDHWDRLSATSLPNPNSGIDAAALDNGSIVLVYNPLEHGKDWVIGRNILTVAVSKDGEHWNDVCRLENEKDGEFSYPAVIQASDSTIHITYTANRKTIRYVVLTSNAFARERESRMKR
ncbi:MAG TPA: sialidase family protein [Bacteroidota bacterium]|nr:sialidase family protein [Bacteroidota bacterium]